MMFYLIEKLYVFSLRERARLEEVLWGFVINRAKPIKTILDPQPLRTLVIRKR